MKIGIIGLGNMGGRIAGRLLNQGCDIGVYDTNELAVKELQRKGARKYCSVRELGENHTLVLTVLPDASVVRQVVLGDEGLLHSLQPGSILVDMTSSVAAVTRDIALRLAMNNIEMVDAPVSGGVKKAEQGTLAIMVGGSVDTVATVMPVLEKIGEQIVHLGDIGTGHTAKALNNLVSATTLTVTAEAMALAVKMGVDAQKMLAALNAGSGRSASSEIKFPDQVLSGKFELGFSLALMCKDIGIAVDMAHDARVPVWISSTVFELWKYGVSRGYGDKDHTAVVQLIEDLANVEIRA